jgi:hypothetical protein
MSILLVALGTGTNMETDRSYLSPYHVAETQEAAPDSQAPDGQILTTPLAPYNDTTADVPAGFEKLEIHICWNKSLASPTPFPSPPAQPAPERIRPPGTFPIFYDGIGNSADECPKTSSPENAVATASDAGQQ